MTESVAQLPHHCHRQIGLHQVRIRMRESSSRTREWCKRTNFRRKRASETRRRRTMVPGTPKRGTPTESQNTGSRASISRAGKQDPSIPSLSARQKQTAQAVAIVIVPQTSANSGWWRLDGVEHGQEGETVSVRAAPQNLRRSPPAFCFFPKNKSVDFFY